MMSILVFEFFTNYLRMDLWILVNYLNYDEFYEQIFKVIVLIFCLGDRGNGGEMCRS